MFVRRFLLVLALCALALGCRRADVVDRVPLMLPLHSFHSATVAVYAPGVEPTAVVDFIDRLRTRLEREGIFVRVSNYPTASELLIRVTLMAYGDQPMFAVELFDERRRWLVGRFDVIVDSRRRGSIPASINERVMTKVADAIVARLDELSR